MTQDTLTGTPTTDVSLPAEIHDLAALEAYLNAALRLEHATIPPYLTALYSMHPGANPDARRVLRAVVVEEMLHLTLVANVMNALGLEVDLTAGDFVPVYPARLPDGESDFAVDIGPFSRAAVKTFLKIERPAAAPDEDRRQLRREPHGPGTRLGVSPFDASVSYYSIGEFYQEIERGLHHVARQYRHDGHELFTGDPARQVTPEYFYSGGGEVVVVTGLASALAALRLITEQGEGTGGGIFDPEGELSHYYRFQQLDLGRYYRPGDDPGHPSGPALNVDYDAVYPAAVNAALADYPAGSPVHEAALRFADGYADFRVLLTRAFGGQPSGLLEAVPAMFRLRDDINRLLRNPHPTQPGRNAAPVFVAGDGATVSGTPGNTEEGRR